MVPDSSLRCGSTVPMGGSLVPKRGSTRRVGQASAMHRRTAGSQRPLGSIRALKLDTHGTSTEPEEGGSPRSRPVRREEAGDGNLEPWMGSREPRRRAAALACALFTLRRDRSCLSIRAAGRPHGRSHTATSASLVKNHCASFSSKRSRCAGSLRVKITAHPLRGSTRPQAFSLASEPVHEPLGHGACTWAQAGDSGDGLLCMQGHVVK